MQPLGGGQDPCGPFAYASDTFKFNNSHKLHLASYSILHGDLTTSELDLWLSLKVSVLSHKQISCSCSQKRF